MRAERDGEQRHKLSPTLLNFPQNCILQKSVSHDNHVMKEAVVTRVTWQQCDKCM